MSQTVPDSQGTVGRGMEEKTTAKMPEAAAPLASGERIGYSVRKLN
jgi:hypothetical protein